MKFVISKRKNDEYEYRLVTKKGEVLIISEGHSTKLNVKKAIKMFIKDLKPLVDHFSFEINEKINDIEIENEN